VLCVTIRCKLIVAAPVRRLMRVTKLIFKLAVVFLFVLFCAGSGTTGVAALQLGRNLTTEPTNRPYRNRCCLLNQVLFQLPARHSERAQGQGLVFELDLEMTVRHATA
jgi:hypothetical protein